MLSTYLLGTLAALPCVVKALAMPAVLPTTPTTTCLKVVSQNDVSGTPWQIGLTAKGGASISVSETHTVGTSWSVGASLGLTVKEVISMGLDASVSQSVSNGVTAGSTLVCPPGPWHCSGVVYPGMLQVKGLAESTKTQCSTIKWDSTALPYTVEIPRTAGGGNSYGDPEVCVCTNAASWAASGAPSIKCPEPCVLPQTTGKA